MSTRSLISPGFSPHEALEYLADTLEAMVSDLRKLAAPPTPATDRDPSMTIDVVAKRLGMSAATVRARCRSGKMPAFRDGKTWRVSEAGFQAFVRRRTQ